MINNYPIAPLFPNGLLLNLLIQQMPNVWPADLFPAEYSVKGAANAVITAGTLKVETVRVLTPQEQADALNHFAIHNPADGVPAGVTIATLPEPTIAGVWFFVSDLERSTGPGAGTMAYSNGTEWRRGTDDALVS